MNGDKWRVGNHGSGKHTWFVCLGWRPEQYKNGYHISSEGVVIRYATWESAQAVANRLNSEMDAS